MKRWGWGHEDIAFTLAEFLQRRRDFDLDAMCLASIGYEGSKRHVRAQRKLAGRIVARHGGVCIGSGPGVLYDQKKFDTPYIRDYLLDRGALADVSETAAPWSLLPKVYDSVMGAAHAAFRSLGVHALAPPCGGHRARGVAGAGHLDSRCRDVARARDGVDPGGNLNSGKVV